MSTTEDFELDDNSTSGDELLQEVTLKIDAGQQTERIDKFLANRLTSNISRTKIQYAAEAGNIIVNGKPVKSNYKIRPNDSVLLIFPKHSENYDLTPENIPLEILYEDESLMVINKQANLVVHPGLGNPRGTLINAAMYHFEQLPPSKEPFRPGLVHRLDKDTTGVMVIAKTEQALAHLAKQFFDRTIQRKYIALAWGDIAENQGTVDAHIGRHSRQRMQMEVFPDGSFGKPAITHYKVLERLNYVTLVECQLETGRTHQIRVHMKHIGHTLFGDVRYEGNKILKGTIHTKYKQFIENCFEILPRQALHAAILGFKHPVTGKEMFFEKELPPDFQTILEKWRRYWLDLSKKLEE
ncbi:MAG: RluA family pseudouridine synthase [Chitinophagales bacterium]|nr:RluA family pseudouridine synthase [Chitinophagales bacterium]